jgi:ribosomal protein S18 acetylase RimI-like enzyme
MRESISRVNGDIGLLGTSDEAVQCARLMTDSEPWRTLGRDYETSLHIVTDPVKEIYVAFIGAEAETVAGFLVLNMTGAFVGYIQTVCVAPEWRRRGLGAILIRFAEERIFREAPNVFMCVSSFNADAQRLYERLGYQRIGELTDYIVASYSEMLLRKTIGPLTGFQPAALEQVDEPLQRRLPTAL